MSVECVVCALSVLGWEKMLHRLSSVGNVMLEVSSESDTNRCTLVDHKPRFKERFG